MNQFTKQLAILFIALTSLQSCDVEKFIDTNIKEKSLVVIAPDFIQNRIAIVFEDADTGALIEEDLEVRLIASEMLIDLAGNYKNDFTAKRGLLNFAVDPNANNSEAVTLNIDAIYNKSGDKMATYQETFKLENSSNSTVLRIPLSIQNSVNQGASKFDVIRPLFYITVNEISYYEDDKDSFGNTHIINHSKFTALSIPLSLLLTYFDVIEYTTKVIEINAYNPIDWSRLSSYEITVIYKNDGGFKKRVVVDLEGNVSNSEYRTSPNNAIETFDFNSEITAKFPNYFRSFTLEKVSEIKGMTLKYTFGNNLVECQDGYNLVFEGLEEGDSPNFAYKIFINSDGNNSHIGIANPNSREPLYNSTKKIKSHIYGSASNKIVFADNPQYIIEPQQMDLGGEDSCGKTFNFKVYPKDGHDRYTLNLQFQCEGEEFSTAPSLTAFLEEESSTSKSIIQLENGSTSLVLKPEATYSVQGSFNETDFGFTFTANESQIEQAIAKTIAENNNIKDIEYTISKINNVESVINAKIIFKEGACPE